MNEYIVNVIGLLLPNGEIKKQTFIRTVKVRAMTPEDAAKAAEEYTIKNNGPLDVMMLRQIDVFDLSDMDTITADI